MLAFLSKILLRLLFESYLASNKDNIVFFLFTAGVGDTEAEMGAGIALLGFPFTLYLGVSFPYFGVIF